jgi:integrase|tara:strand:+ start:805 stop:1845 length:1041 start_codon:yes stop_codon:yes gene_type:complete
MTNHNPVNERIKRKYLIFQKEAKRKSEATIDAIAKSLARFEEYTKWKDFKRFRYEQAIGFKQHLASQVNGRTDKPLSLSTISATLNHLKQFFGWLSDKPGYKSRLNYTDAEYFNLSEKDARIATARRPKQVPTIAQIRHVIQNMPSGNDIELRNRALIAFTLLTGARDSAIASLSLKHVDLIERSVFQDAREVKTKFSKTFTIWFFPVGDDIEEIVREWVTHLRETLLWGNEHPLFPATRVDLGNDRQYSAQGLKHEHWRTTTSIRRIFKEAFQGAGLNYYNPHSFRDTLAQLGERTCRTPEQFKAWSQNLGHENVLTTFTSYGEVSQGRQKEILGLIGRDGQTVG